MIEREVNRIGLTIESMTPKTATISHVTQATGGAARLPLRKVAMNPIWTQMINKAVKGATRVCSACGKSAAYTRKKAGQFYKCKYCGHRFKEKGRSKR